MLYSELFFCAKSQNFFNLFIRLYTAHCKTISCVINSIISVSGRSFQGWVRGQHVRIEAKAKASIFEAKAKASDHDC